MDPMLCSIISVILFFALLWGLDMLERIKLIPVVNMTPSHWIFFVFASILVSVPTLYFLVIVFKVISIILH